MKLWTVQYEAIENHTRPAADRNGLPLHRIQYVSSGIDRCDFSGPA